MTPIEKYLLEKYGPTLSTNDLAEVFKYANGGSVHDALSREQFPIPRSEMRKQGKFVVADYFVVAQFFDKQRASA